MKINFVIPTPGNTGGLQVIYKYAEEFQKKGHDVRIYYPLKLYLLDYSLNKYSTDNVCYIQDFGKYFSFLYLS